MCSGVFEVKLDEFKELIIELIVVFCDLYWGEDSRDVLNVTRIFLGSGLFQGTP